MVTERVDCQTIATGIGDLIRRMITDAIGNLHMTDPAEGLMIKMLARMNADLLTTKELHLTKGKRLMKSVSHRTKSEDRHTKDERHLMRNSPMTESDILLTAELEAQVMAVGLRAVMTQGKDPGHRRVRVVEDLYLRGTLTRRALLIPLDLKKVVIMTGVGNKFQE